MSMNKAKTIEKLFGTSLDRVKWLGYRMFKTCERERTSVGESKVSCDYLIEELTDKFRNLKHDDLPKNVITKLMNSVPEEAWNNFLDAVPTEVLQYIFKSIHTERSKLAEIKMAAQSFTQCLIDRHGEDVPLPNIEVSERDGKTVFNFVIEE